MNLDTYLGFLLISPMAYICLKYLIKQIIEIYKEEISWFYVYIAWLSFVLGLIIVIIFS